MPEAHRLRHGQLQAGHLGEVVSHTIDSGGEVHAVGTATREPVWRRAPESAYLTSLHGSCSRFDRELAPDGRLDTNVEHAETID